MNLENALGNLKNIPTPPPTAHRIGYELSKITVH
ncbi:hypothetical protein XF_0206 [Xylella fastidiosa 9a5c]|uniref:Uncharacterized protein n=1 Tax=Xylella fastidiosa (strain 9a5c) TaxID=160492 RepID=Q9PGU2_XYLFA|nr:hypothetical protein XF_0206 [Xylella fastidiosa 9a5c]